jgi:hypothetical protein
MSITKFGKAGVDEQLVGVVGNELDLVAVGGVLDTCVGEPSGVRATTGCKSVMDADNDEPEGWLDGRRGTALLTEVEC